MSGYVYLLHFEQPYKHAKHYLGYAKSVKKRIEEHRNGTGARLTTVIKHAGIPFVVARVWRNGTRGLERKLKNRHNAPRLCPICSSTKGNQS